MNDRMEQVNGMLHQRLAEVFSQKVEVPFEFFITITKIDCSKDLKHARVFLSILPFDKSQKALGWIIKNRGEIQKQLSKLLKNFRNTPKLKYIIDETEEKSNEIYDLIDNL